MTYSVIARPVLQAERAYATIVDMNRDLKKVLERAQGWPEEAQEKLVWMAYEIEKWLNEDCRSESDDLRAR